MVDSTMSQQNFFADGDDGLGDDGLGDNGPVNAQHIDPALRAPDTRVCCCSIVGWWARPFSLYRIANGLSQTEREKILASKSSMDARQVRKKRPAPPDNERPGGEDAAAVVAEMAEDDARERKLTSVSHWQVFLYHSRRPEKDEEVSIAAPCPELQLLVASRLWIVVS